MADDLGDSHPRSLRQGGALPAASLQYRMAGKVYAAAGKQITYKLFPSFERQIGLYLTDECGNALDSVKGSGPLTKSFTPAMNGWYQFQVRNLADTNAAQRVWIQVSYFAPDTLNALATRSRLRPFADLGPDRYGCNGSSISLNPGFSDLGLSFSWKDSQGIQIGTGATQPINSAGLYSVTIINTITGCTAFDSVRIFSFQDPPPSPLVQKIGDTLKIMNVLPGVHYSWRLNGSSNPADSLPYFIVPSGSLSVNLTSRNEFGCQNVTANLLTSSTEILHKRSFEIFPNPTEGSLFLRAANKLQGKPFLFRDMTGRILAEGIYQGYEQEISLPKLPAGLYLISLGGESAKIELK
jgi:alpha-amylase